MNSSTPETQAAASNLPQSHPASASEAGLTCGDARVLVTVATYNEMENLPILVRDLQEALPAADLLVVDDNSPDGTGRWIAAQAEQNRQISVLHRPRKLGLGSATVAGLQYAVEHGYDYVVALDGDGSHDPRYIPGMLEAIDRPSPDRPDVVIGSRYVPGGGTNGWPAYRRLMSRAVNSFARVMLGLSVRDCSGAFRCIRVEFLNRVDLSSFRSRGYSLFEETLWHFKKAGARFHEIPIVFANRQHGESKIDFRESISAVWMLLRMGIRNRLGLDVKRGRKCSPHEKS
jgi:dolichol-phosphate mannosyltransferase